MVTGLAWRKSLRYQYLTREKTDSIQVTTSIIFYFFIFSHICTVYRKPAESTVCLNFSDLLVQKLTNMRIMKENMRTGNLPANMKKNRVLQIIPCKKEGKPLRHQFYNWPGLFVHILLCSHFRWLQQSHSLHEARTGVHRLHQCILHRCTQVSFFEFFETLIAWKLKPCVSLPLRVTDRRTTLLPPRAPSHTQWKTSGEWSGSGNVTPLSCSQSSRRGSR